MIMKKIFKLLKFLCHSRVGGNPYNNSHQKTALADGFIATVGLRQAASPVKVNKIYHKKIRLSNYNKTSVDRTGVEPAPFTGEVNGLPLTYRPKYTEAGVLSQTRGARIKYGMAGFIIPPVAIVVLLLAGLAAGLILVRQTQIFKPRAQDEQGSFIMSVSPPNFSVPQSVSYTASATVPNVSLNHIKIFTAGWDGNVDQATLHQYGGDYPCSDESDGATCSVAIPPDTYGVNDEGNWIVFMEVYYNDSSQGVQLWCSGEPNATYQCPGGSQTLTANPPASGGTCTVTANPSQIAVGSPISFSAVGPAGYDICSSPSSPYSFNGPGNRTGDTCIPTGNNWTCTAAGSGQTTFTARMGPGGNCTANSPISCSTTFQVGGATGGLTVSCSANLTSVTTGQSVAWTAGVSGATGPYTYTWSGSDNLVATTANSASNTNIVNKPYSNTGTKTAQVTVSAGTQSKTQQCSNSVNVGSVTPTVNPSQCVNQGGVCSSNPSICSTDPACNVGGCGTAGVCPSNQNICANNPVCNQGGVPTPTTNQQQCATNPTLPGCVIPTAICTVPGWTGTACNNLVCRMIVDANGSNNCNQVDAPGQCGALPASCQPTVVPTTVQPTAVPTAVPTGVQPTATNVPQPTGVGTTRCYRVAEPALIGPVSQDNYPDGRPCTPYTPGGVDVNNFTFQNSNPGQKTVCVLFIGTDGAGQRATDLKCTDIYVVGVPQITGCNLDLTGPNTSFQILGTGFGSSSTGASVKTGTTLLSIGTWADNQVEAKLTGQPTAQDFPITLTTPEGLVALGACSSISQLAIGAQLFCPQVKDVTFPNTDVTIVEAVIGGKTFNEKATLSVSKVNGVGILSGLTTKLQEGRGYKLAIKVPKGVRRVLNNPLGGFIAVRGTTNVAFTAATGNGARLPLGDIFPVGVGDGSINGGGFSQLKNDISSAQTPTTNYSDLNQDGWVNSFEWACMRPDIGTSDDPIPTAGPLNTAILTPTTSGSVTSIPSPTTAGANPTVTSFPSPTTQNSVCTVTINNSCGPAGTLQDSRGCSVYPVASAWSCNGVQGTISSCTQTGAGCPP